MESLPRYSALNHLEYLHKSQSLLISQFDRFDPEERYPI